jgi:hypothetical protein
MQCAKAGFDIAQAFSPRQLREHHAKKLVPTREGPNPVVAVVSSNTAIEFVPRNEVEQLSKKDSSCVHEPSPRVGFSLEYGYDQDCSRNRKRSSVSATRCSYYSFIDAKKISRTVVISNW